MAWHKKIWHYTKRTWHHTKKTYTKVRRFINSRPDEDPEEPEKKDPYSWPPQPRE